MQVAVKAYKKALTEWAPVRLSTSFEHFFPGHWGSQGVSTLSSVLIARCFFLFFLLLFFFKHVFVKRALCASTEFLLDILAVTLNVDAMINQQCDWVSWCFTPSQPVWLYQGSWCDWARLNVVPWMNVGNLFTLASVLWMQVIWIPDIPVDEIQRIPSRPVGPLQTLVKCHKFPDRMT